MVQYKIFTFLEDAYSAEIEAEMNRFLLAHKVLAVNEYYSAQSGALRFCIKYETNGRQKPPEGVKKSKIDYKAELTNDEYVQFELMRQVRNNLAAELGEAKYAICVNDSLYYLAKANPETFEGLAKVEGLEPSFVKNYSERWWQMYQIAKREKGTL